MKNISLKYNWHKEVTTRFIQQENNFEEDINKMPDTNRQMPQKPIYFSLYLLARSSNVVKLFKFKFFLWNFEQIESGMNKNCDLDFFFSRKC